jgi:hypothetical protein
MTADFYELDLLKEIMNWDTRNVTAEELNKLLLATDKEGNMNFIMDAIFCELELFKRMLNCAKRI